LPGSGLIAFAPNIGTGTLQEDLEKD